MIEKFEERVKHFQEIFGLSNWTIYVEVAPIDELNHNAKTIADPRYNTANMTIYPRLLELEQEWDNVIVHELIHIVMALYDFFADNMSKDDTDELFFIARESAVSQLTNIMGRILK